MAYAVRFRPTILTNTRIDFSLAERDRISTTFTVTLHSCLERSTGEKRKEKILFFEKEFSLLLSPVFP
jgi:hypothetical protein